MDLRVTQVRSAIGTKPKHRGTLRALGLGRIGRTNVLPYTIWMPEIDTAHAVSIPSPTTAETVITSEGKIG